MHFKQNYIYQSFPSYSSQDDCGPRTFERDRQWFILHKRGNYKRYLFAICNQITSLWKE